MRVAIGPCSHLLHLQVHHGLEDVRHQQGDAGDEQRQGQDPRRDEAQRLHGRRPAGRDTAATSTATAAAGHKGRAAASPRLLTGREEPPGLPGPPDPGFGSSRAGGARLGAGGEGSGRAPARRRLCGVGSAPLVAPGREGGNESRKGLVCSCWQEFPVSARGGPASGRAAGVFQRFSGKQAGKQLPSPPQEDG